MLTMLLEDMSNYCEFIQKSENIKRIIREVTFLRALGFGYPDDYIFLKIIKLTRKNKLLKLRYYIYI